VDRLFALLLLVGSIVASPGVDLGGLFGRADASATQISAEQVELRLSVEAATGATVVAHLIEPGGDQRAYPLPETDDGSYQIIAEIRKVNYIVVFEIVDGELGSQSQPLLLTDLGVAPAVLGILTSAPREVPQSDSTSAWGWAGLGLGALSLLALAIWAMPGRNPAPDNAKSQPDDTLQ
jgi:hypothetical protein